MRLEEQNVRYVAKRQIFFLPNVDDTIIIYVSSCCVGCYTTYKWFLLSSARTSLTVIFLFSFLCTLDDESMVPRCNNELEPTLTTAGELQGPW